VRSARWESRAVVEPTDTEQAAVALAWTSVDVATASKTRSHVLNGIAD
jgi:hypothetical protein